ISDRDDLAGFQERMALQRRLGVDVRLISPEDARALVPALHVDDLIGAVWGPQDGMAGPAEVTAGYARRARELGARIEEGVDVTAVVVEHGRVTGVRTAQGDVGTRIVINAAGPTAARVAKLAGVGIPVLPRRRHIFYTEPFPEIPGPVPLTTDRASGFYFRKEMDQLLLSPGDGTPRRRVAGGRQALPRSLAVRPRALRTWRRSREEPRPRRRVTSAA